ncbi:channel accessory protein ArfC [Mycobacterium botniense]
MITLAFLLGLVLTFALTVRRVKCEVPVTPSAGDAETAAGEQPPSVTNSTAAQDDPGDGSAASESETQ